MAPRARRGKSSTGWFFGFKLHLVHNDRGELLGDGQDIAAQKGHQRDDHRWFVCAAILGFVSKVVPTPSSASLDVRNAGEGTRTTFTADAF